MFIRSTPFAGAVLLVSLAASSAAAEADLEAGRTIFTETAQPPCSICHALADADAEGEIGPNLDEFKPTVDQVRAAVSGGIGVMPAFDETLSAEEIELVSLYVAEVTGGLAADAEAEGDGNTAMMNSAAAATLVEGDSPSRN